MNKYILAALLFAGYNAVHAEVKLPAIFSDGMVMQQQTKANLWGTANPDKTVSVKTGWDNKAYKVKSDSEGKWALSVDTPVAGGPYTLTFNDGVKSKIENILIGELWLCSGQSNMEMPMKGFKNQPIANSGTDILNSKDDNLRLFTVKRKSSFDAQTDVTGKWSEAAPASVREFSATAYYFGEILREQLNVPVGLVVAAWGGSACVAGMHSDWLKAFPAARIPQSEADLKSKNRHPTVL